MCQSGKIVLPIRYLYWIVALAALAVRGGLFAYWRHSPLAAFHELPGLDMASHLLHAARFGAGEVSATIYRVLVLVLRGNVAAVIALQMLAGAAVALLVTYVTLRLRGNRLHALAAGLTAAFYGAALMYECTLLQETVTTLAAFAAFAAVLHARRRHFSPGRTIFAGLLLALAGTGRPVGLLLVAGLFGWAVWYQYRRRAGAVRTALLLAGTIAAVWAPLSVLNYRLEKMPLPFYISNARYIVDVVTHGNRTSWHETAAPPSAVSAVSAPSAVPAPSPSRWEQACRAGAKLPMLFSPTDLPDNVNYTFFRDHVPGFRWLIPPGALIPAGLAGLLALAIARRRRDALAAIWYLAPLALVVAAYFPSGRHRLILYPALAIYAWYPLFMPCARHGWRMGAALMLIAIGWFGYHMPSYIRAADYANWAMALERMPQPTDNPEAWFLRAYEIAPQRTVNLVRIIQPALRRGDRERAAQLLAQYPVRDSHHAYFSGVLALWNGRPQLATAAFQAVNPNELTGLERPYHFYYGEALKAQGKSREALRQYDLALSHTQDPAQRERIERSRAACQQDL